MTQTPRGWVRTTLGELGRYLNGRGFKKTEWAKAGRPIIRIQNLTGSGSGFNYFAGKAEERHVVRRGDLLVSWAATLGVYEWDGPEAVLNQHIFKVESFIDRRFHKYLIERTLNQLLAQAHGTGMVHITRRPFDKTPVLLPPRAEQQRIVEAIEEQFSRVDAATDSLVRGQANLARLRLASQGRALRLALKWPTATLSSVLAEGLMNGRSVRTQAGGFPVLRLSALRSSTIDLSERKYGAWDQTDAERYLVRAGDFLVARGNGTLSLVGRGGLVPANPDQVAFRTR